MYGSRNGTLNGSIYGSRNGTLNGSMYGSRNRTEKRNGNKIIKEKVSMKMVGKSGQGRNEKYPVIRPPKCRSTLRKLCFLFLSHLMGYDRGDNFPFDFLNQMEFHLVQKIEKKTVTTIISHSM